MAATVHQPAIDIFEVCCPLTAPHPAPSSCSPEQTQNASTCVSHLNILLLLLPVLNQADMARLAEMQDVIGLRSLINMPAHLYCSTEHRMMLLLSLQEGEIEVLQICEAPSIKGAVEVVTHHVNGSTNTQSYWCCF